MKTVEIKPEERRHTISVLTRDGIHLTEKGGEMMAREIIKELYPKNRQ